MKVTDLKTKELNKNAMERNNYKNLKKNKVNVIFAATMHFIHLLKVSFFLLIKSHKGAKFQKKTHIKQLSYSL